MTREEAMQVLNMVETHGLADKAKEMAIKALEHEDVLDKMVDRCIEGEHIEYDFTEKKYVIVRYVRETIFLPDELQQHIERFKKEVPQ